MMSDVLKKIRDENIYFIEAKESAQQEWAKTCHDIADATVFKKATSWYVGANIPGKKREQLNYIGGLPSYFKACSDGLKDWSKFDTKKLDSIQTAYTEEITARL